jgi:hypothetical protein
MGVIVTIMVPATLFKQRQTVKIGLNRIGEHEEIISDSHWLTIQSTLSSLWGM